MKYDNAKLRRLLAAEYALGTLAGRARRRFDRLLQGDAALRAELQFWESRLGELAQRIKPVTPPPTVWIGLQKRIEQGNTVPLRPQVQTQKSQAGRRGPPLWRIGAGLATAAAVVVAVLLNQPAAPPGPAAPPVASVPPAAVSAYVALLKMPDSDMQWTVSLTPARGRMTVIAVGSAPRLSGRSPELWWLSPGGPVAIGVLPVSGDGSMPLPQGLAEGAELKLAISIEPPGGSPTGQPTGPVVTSAIAVRTA